jgi:long-chain acyl-CoA synthetase
VNEKNCLTFSYTSGTTGPPKGAMISHGNFLGLIATLKNHELKGFSPDDVYVSFLPLPHIMERAIVVAMMYIGAFIA